MVLEITGNVPHKKHPPFEPPPEPPPPEPPYFLTQLETQQSATSEHVKERMQQIAVLVNQTATEARNSAQACQGLSELAVDLQKMVANFQLRSDDGFQHHRALPSDGISQSVCFKEAVLGNARR